MIYRVDDVSKFETSDICERARDILAHWEDMDEPTSSELEYTLARNFLAINLLTNNAQRVGPNTSGRRMAPW